MLIEQRVAEQAAIPTRVGAHGGKRQGAGRPRTIEDAARRSFVLRQDQMAWLELRARNRSLNLSEYLRQIIDDAMILRRQKSAES